MAFPKSLEIPFDVIELIINNVASWDDDNNTANWEDDNSDTADYHDCKMILKCCALVSRLFLQLSRKYLFERICLDFVHDLQNMEKFAALLRASPEIAIYVRNLILDIYDFQRIPMDLMPFSRLKRLQLSFSFKGDEGFLDFNKINSPQLKNILLYPIPTLETLDLSCISNYPFYNLLLLYPNLRCLTVSQITVDEILFPIGASPLQPIKLDNFTFGGGYTGWQGGTMRKLLQLQHSDGKPVIDISGLRCLDVWYEEDSMWTAVRRLPGGIDQFRGFLIAPCDGCGLNGLGRLLLPFMKSFKRINIYAVLFRDPDPFFGLCEELQILGAHPSNVLEQLSFYGAVSNKFEPSNHEWGKLDEVIDGFAWPVLKEVKLCIDIGRQRGREDGAGETIIRSKLDALPARYLPKLSAKSRKGLDFQYLVGYG